jgi:hypothetical protein
MFKHWAGLILPQYCLSIVQTANHWHNQRLFIYVKKWKDVMCEFSEASQCANDILGVDGTAAAFLVTFSAAGKSNSHSRLEREARKTN